MDAGAQHIYICEHHKNVIQVKMFLLDQQLLNSCQKIVTSLQKLQKDWQMNADGEDKEEEEGERR